MSPWKWFCLGSALLVFVFGWALVFLGGPIVYTFAGQDSPPLFEVSVQVGSVFALTYLLFLYGVSKRYWRKP